MGRSTTRQRVDDLDGSSATQTVMFALDGRQFEIDLSAANAKLLREIFLPYVAAGRRLGRSHRGGSTKAAAAMATGGRNPVAARRHLQAESEYPDASSSSEVSGSAEQIGSRAALPSLTSPATPLAAVVPMRRRLPASVGDGDLAGQRRRLAADLAELLRVSAVATLAAVADRLVALIVDPAFSAGKVGNSASGAPGDPPEDAARIKPRATGASSVAPAG